MATEPDARSDVELLHDARAGERAAFDHLYLRHRPAARRLARSYRGPDDADDLVNAAFEQVMAAVLRGGGPEGPLRPYLFVALRRLAMRRPGPGRHEPLDVLPDSALAAEDLPDLDDVERSLVTEAFLDLPDRWQVVLWQVAVEGRPPREVARGTGMSPNAVSALAYRARERLRQTYLQAHVGTGGGRCAPHRAHLGSYVRGRLGRRQRGELEAHLDRCAGCTQLLAELDDVNRLLARTVLPLFVVGSESGAPPLAGGATAAAGGTGATTSAAGATVGSAAGATSGVAVPATASLAGAGAGALGLGAVAKAAVFAAVTLVAGVAAVNVPGSSDPDPVHGTDVEASSGGRAAPAGDVTPRTSPARRSPATPATPGTTVPPSPTEDGNARPPDAPAERSGMDGAGAEAAEGGPAAPVPADAGPGIDASLGLDAQRGVRAGASAEVAPGTGVGAGVAIDPARGVDLDVSWTAGPLGTGTLDVGLVDPAGALADAEIIVDLSPGARVAATGTGCAPASGEEGSPRVSPLRMVSCPLRGAVDGLAGSFALPLAVTGGDATASVRLQLGSQPVRSVVVALT
jgi:RNA polymerase sigma factor (sigma-70 family)